MFSDVYLYLEDNSHSSKMSLELAAKNQRTNPYNSSLTHKLESTSYQKKTHLQVVICTKKREKILRDCLESLYKEKQIVPAYTVRILVIGSPFENDEFFKLVADYKQKFGDSFQATLQKGVGLPNARNYIFPVKQAEIVLFLDDDVVLRNGYLMRLLNHFEKNRLLGGLSGSYQKTPRVTENVPRLLKRIKSILDRALIGGDPNEAIGEVWETGVSSTNFDLADCIRQVKRLSGCNMAYRREAIEAVGKFDEEYGSSFATGEDCDYSFRVFRKGYSLLVDPLMRVHHKNVDESVFPQSKGFFIDLGKNTARMYLKFFCDRGLFSFFTFVISSLYLSILYELLALIKKSSLRGVNYFKGVLIGLARQKSTTYTEA